MNITIDDLLKGKIHIERPDQRVRERCKLNWDHLSKPLDSLGEFERIHQKIGAIQGLEDPDLEHTLLIVCCGDHGIVEEGVSQSDQSITRICAESIGQGITTAGILCKAADTDIVSVDVGVNYEGQIPNTLYKRVKNGTKNFLKESAMTRQELMQSLQVGIDLVRDYQEKGYTIIATGEMGIGNTTSASVMAARFLGLSADEVTGRGAGLDDAGLNRKRAVIDTAIHMTCGDSSLEILEKFGGLELACMSGMMIGGAVCHVPIVIDGVLSMISALAAEQMLPGVKEYLIPSHVSREPVAALISEELGLKPVLDGDMAVGEGAGAAMMIGLLKQIDHVYREAVRFGDSGVEQYVHYDHEDE